MSSNLYGTSFDNSYAKPVGQCILTIRIDELMYEDLDQGETSFFLVDSHGIAAPLNANAKKHRDASAGNLTGPL